MCERAPCLAGRVCASGFHASGFPANLFKARCGDPGFAPSAGKFDAWIKREIDWQPQHDDRVVV